jgi:hypothetical protein
VKRPGPRVEHAILSVTEGMKFAHVVAETREAFTRGECEEDFAGVTDLSLFFEEGTIELLENSGPAF